MVAAVHFICPFVWLQPRLGGDIFRVDVISADDLLTADDCHAELVDAAAVDALECHRAGGAADAPPRRECIAIRAAIVVCLANLKFYRVHCLCPFVVFVIVSVRALLSP